MIAFGVALLAAAALVAATLLLRDDGTTSASGAPPLDLAGIPQDGTVLGSPDATVRLVEYADQQCPACAVYAAEVIPVVVDGYVRPGRIALEYRGFPFIGEDSVKAHRFLLAAGEQNRLWELEDALYRNQGGENDGWVTDELLRQLAEGIEGLDVDRLFTDAEREDIVARADAAAGEAEAAGVRATPTFFVVVGDEEPYLIQVGSAEQMRAALDDALRG